MSPWCHTITCSERAACGSGESSGARALRVKRHDLPGHFLHIWNAVEADGGLRGRIVRAGQSCRANERVAGAIGAFHVIHRNDVGGRAGLYRATAIAADDHDTLVGDGVNGAASSEISPQRSEDDSESYKKEGKSEEGEEPEPMSERITGSGDVLTPLVGAVDPEKREASKGNAKQCRGKGRQSRAAGV